MLTIDQLRHAPDYNKGEKLRCDVCLGSKRDTSTQLQLDSLPEIKRCMDRRASRTWPIWRACHGIIHILRGTHRRQIRENKIIISRYAALHNAASDHHLNFKKQLEGA